MNKMKEVAELLGVEFGEVFDIKFDCETVVIKGYSMSENVSMYENHIGYDETLIRLLFGDVEIIKMPWTPKNGERYYTPHPTCGLYDDAIWDDDEIDKDNFRNTGVYKTQEEAIAKSKEYGWT